MASDREQADIDVAAFTDDLAARVKAGKLGMNECLLELGHFAVEAQTARLRLERALEDVDRLAEAGLCQFSSGGKHEFLRDIRRAVNEAGINGGIVPFAPTHAALEGKDSPQPEPRLKTLLRNF